MFASNKVKLLTLALVLPLAACKPSYPEYKWPHLLSCTKPADPDYYVEVKSISYTSYLTKSSVWILRDTSNPWKDTGSYAQVPGEVCRIIRDDVAP